LTVANVYRPACPPRKDTPALPFPPTGHKLPHALTPFPPVGVLNKLSPGIAPETCVRSDTMSKLPENAGKEQRLLRHARREGLVILVVWAIALLWSVGSAYVLGYGRDAQDIRLILGMPDWVFWSVVLPWVLCL